MEGKKNNIEKYSIWFLVIMYSVGVIGHSIPALLNLMKILTPFTLLLTGGVVFYNVVKSTRKNFLIWCAAVYSVTLSLEIIGVKTGVIFGEYTYGNVLGLKLLDTPLIIGLNWMFVILGAILIVEKLFVKKYLIVLFAGVLAVLFDIVLEPVAIELGYWNWSEGFIPIQNYIAWFIISIFAASLFHLLKIEINSSVPKFYFYIQLIFFVLLNITLAI